MALRSFVDGAVFAEVFGDGPPRVLALHGWGRRGADFKNSLTGISALAPDLPGFGASPPPADVIGAEGYAELISPILSEFEKPPVLVGHSFGGRISVCLAARFPERIGPVILTGAPVVRTAPSRPPKLSYRIIRSLNNVGIVSDERMEKLRKQSGSADYRSATGVMRDILVKVVNESYEPQLRDMQSQVLLLWGDSDGEVPVSVARTTAEIIGATGDEPELRVLEGVGHHVPVEAPEELRKAIDSVLE
ncbi:MAG: alpha/beta hydrolase [Actinobacteria bacterium]|nr:alpha/beta hydrolase [Actinomycetota bacterium]